MWPAVTPPSLINAHQQDANMQFLAQYNRQGWSLAATSDITTVEQLAGKTLAVHSETSFTKTVADLIIKSTTCRTSTKSSCPVRRFGLKLYSAGRLIRRFSISRTSYCEPSGSGRHQHPRSFLAALPELTSVRFMAMKPWIDAHPALAKEVVKALIEANRHAVDDPDWVISQAQAYYDDQDPAIVEEIIRAFIEGDHWVLDGGMSEENAQGEHFGTSTLGRRPSRPTRGEHQFPLPPRHPQRSA